MGILGSGRCVIAANLSCLILPNSGCSSLSACIPSYFRVYRRWFVELCGSIFSLRGCRDLPPPPCWDGATQALASISRFVGAPWITGGQAKGYLPAWSSPLDAFRRFSATLHYHVFYQVAGRSDRLKWLRDDGKGTRVDRKNIIEAVDKSLKRLDTDYIDLLQVRTWQAYSFGNSRGMRVQQCACHP